MGGIGQVGFLEGWFHFCIHKSDGHFCYYFPLLLHRKLLEHDWYGVIPMIYLIIFWIVT